MLLCCFLLIEIIFKYRSTYWALLTIGMYIYIRKVIYKNYVMSGSQL